MLILILVVPFLLALVVLFLFILLPFFLFILLLFFYLIVLIKRIDFVNALQNNWLYSETRVRSAIGHGGGCRSCSLQLLHDCGGCRCGCSIRDRLHVCHTAFHSDSTQRKRILFSSHRGPRDHLISKCLAHLIRECLVLELAVAVVITGSRCRRGCNHGC